MPTQAGQPDRTKRSDRRPTIDDVARAAGVSRGTVSRVLNGGHWVSPDSLAAVNAAIRKTGYRINPHARSLATARAGSIAFLLTESQDRLFEDPNFAVLMRGASNALAEQDISLVMLLAGNDAERRRATNFITGGHVDGVLMISSHASHKQLISDLVHAKVPAISIGVPLGYERKIGHIAAEDRSGAADAVAYLQSIGRTRIATIAGPQDTGGGMFRLAGYKEQVGEVDPALIAEGDYTKESGAAATRMLLQRAPDLDAIFAANDLMAAGALQVLAEQGRSVPGDVAVVGFDDSSVAMTTTPKLTTMRQPFDRVSREVVRLLLEVIDGQAPASMSLPLELVIRESA